MKTRLIRFSPARANRGTSSRVGAALVEITDTERDMNTLPVWMNENDIRKNLAAFADHEPQTDLQGLRDALAAYQKPWKEVREAS